MNKVIPFINKSFPFIIEIFNKKFILSFSQIIILKNVNLNLKVTDTLKFFLYNFIDELNTLSSNNKYKREYLICELMIDNKTFCYFLFSPIFNFKLIEYALGGGSGDLAYTDLPLTKSDLISINSLKNLFSLSVKAGISHSIKNEDIFISFKRPTYIHDFRTNKDKNEVLLKTTIENDIDHLLNIYVLKSFYD